MHEAIPRIWQSLLLPLTIKKIAEAVWIIAIRGTVQNALHSENTVPVVFRTEQEAKDAFDKVKAMRLDYRKYGTIPIRVNL